MKKIKFLLFCCLYTISYFAHAMDVGIGIHPQTFPKNPQDLVAILKNQGISTFRTDYLWSQVEKEKGVYSPVDQRIEETIQLAKENNIRPLIIYGYGNKFYQDTSYNALEGKPSSEETIQHFLNYVKWSTNHLNNNVSMFEIWNEWIQKAGAGNRISALSNNSAKIYSTLVLQSCRAIKEINPNAIVIAGSTDPLDEASNQWLLKVINYGVLNCIDGISLHIYEFKPNQKLNYKPIILSLKKLQSKISYINKGKTVPLYITETGVSNINNSLYSLEDTANYFTNYMQALSQLNYVRGVWWYDLVNDGNDKNNGENNFGILNRDLSPKPIALKFADTIKKYK
ncbi:glycosyl hydrolase [Acinetobacter soli]|uniref:glycosyl hydrolase n=1 Tax=Acinetobacter soli TaxID=487316 RepID=UPI003018C045